MENPEEASAETMDAAINRVAARIDAWANKSCSDRMVALHRIADEVRFRPDELSKLITREVDHLLALGYQEVAQTH
jgi:acyl-CoA reductase-like NAD-dependent aldehyde dehydrogenase